MMETDCDVVVAGTSDRFGDQNIPNSDLNKPRNMARETLPKPTNSQTEMEDDAPRDSMQSSSSLSSITVSTICGLTSTAKAPPYEASRGKRGVAELEMESVVSDNVGDAVERSITKTLSYRIESMGSMGSMGSLVSSIDLDSEPRESGSTPESGTSSPARKNPNNISNSSLLISALKQNNKMRKKSVSFSLPSEDDIARRAQRKNSALLYDALDQFDDNIPDYQITSPKNGGDGRNGGFRRPVRTQSVTDSRVIGILNSASTKSAFDAELSNSNSSPVRHILPPRPGLVSASSSYAIMSKHSGTEKPSPLKPLLPPPPASFAPHHQMDLLPSVIEEDPSQLSTNSTNSARFSARLTSTTEAAALTEDGGMETEAEGGASPPLTLMQRVHAAKTPAELCEVFGISAESVFNGELVRKRFSRDLLPKQRFVWIVPSTKSIHWAKSAKDRLDNHGVKFFLLDKNSPHVNTTEMLSTATSGKDDPLSIQGGIFGGHRYEQRSPVSPSVRTTFGRISLLSPRAMTRWQSIPGGDGNESGGESALGSPAAAALSSSASTADAGSGDNPTAATGADVDAGADIGAFRRATSDNEASAPDASRPPVNETCLFTPPRASRKHVLPGRACGELVGVIHSAEIHHLTIKIKTESGDYLSFTIGSGGNAVQRAKDWFAVIKALTRDVSPDA